MPKIVDWDARRDEILAATWRVIARDGIARATIRAIAREAGCSRGILAHYFDDKADILGLHLGVADPGRGDRHYVGRAHAHVARAADGQSVVKQASAVADELAANRLKPVRIVAVH